MLWCRYELVWKFCLFATVLPSLERQQDERAKVSRRRKFVQYLRGASQRVARNGDIQVSHQRPGLSVIIAGLRKCSGHDLRLPLATHVKRG